MKLSLVVAQGVHTGKIIPVNAPEFMIGRDPQCQLRPASPAVSKQHCGITVRGGKVFVRDYGSTNGTFVNGEQVAGEREAANGDHLKIGPLEFHLSVDMTSATMSGQLTRPVPKAIVSASETVAASAGGTAVFDPPAPHKADPRRATTTVVESPAAEYSDQDDADLAAALMLGMDDDPLLSPPTLESMAADSTTVMEMPALDAKTVQVAKTEVRKVIGDSSSAAADLLSKYMRRPRT